MLRGRGKADMVFTARVSWSRSSWTEIDTFCVIPSISIVVQGLLGCSRMICRLHLISLFLEGSLSAMHMTLFYNRV
jgi:hypothetical protein